MSDLISREMVIDILKQTGIIQDNDIGHCVIEEINRIPIAYDIDKVVADLEKNASRYTKKYTTPYGNNGYKDTKAISIHKAIEIVKQGGISDDVCEWKQDKGCVGLGAYNISCCDKTLEMPVSTARGLKYCTYCGKKIKVVE